MTTVSVLPSPPFLVITDREQATRDVVAILEAAFAAGCRFAMVRDKSLDRAALTALALRAVAAAQPFGARVLVSGDAEAARAAGAAGVHLPQGRSVAAARDVLGAGALIGVSAHSLAEARAAAAAGADYATVSPVFPTESKPGYGPALGLDGLARIAAAVPIPVLALAGVGPDNAGACFASGAAGVAVMGGLMRAADPGRYAAMVIAALTKIATREGTRSA